MTEQTNTESAQSQGSGVPTPPSQESGQQSSAGATGKSELQELREKVERLEREGQSAKDRGIRDLKKEFETKFAELSGKPVEPEKSESAATKTDTGIVGGAQAIPEALARFTEVGLSVSDADVSALIAKSTEYKTREALLLDAERIINRKTIKPAVSPAAAVQTPSQPPGSPGEAELTEEYIKKVIAARGQPDVIRALRVEYKQKGVAVETIDFRIK